jgi:CBS domain-containing protein
MSEQRVRDVMTGSPATLAKSASVYEAARTMRDNDIGCVLLVDEHDEVCGLLTDRDLVIRGVAEGVDPSKAMAYDICSRELAHLSPDDSVDNAIKLMAKKAIRRIPVMDDGRVAGILSLGDLAQTRDERSALGGISAAPPNR